MCATCRALFGWRLLVCRAVSFSAPGALYIYGPLARCFLYASFSCLLAVHPFRAFVCEIVPGVEMSRRVKDGGVSVAYSDELGRSSVTPAILRALHKDGKLGNVDDARAPGAEVVPTPREDETILFVAFLDAGLRLPCAASVSTVLQLYGVDLAQLTPNSIVKLGVFEWVLRSAGASDGEGRLFAYLHDGRCQPKKKKDTGETLNFGSVNFQTKSRLLQYLPAPAARNRWETDWTHRWFYHKCGADAGLRSRGGPIHLIPSPSIDLTAREDALLGVLLRAAQRMSTRDFVEEFCALRLWPLAQSWSVELSEGQGGIPSLCLGGRAGTRSLVRFFGRGRCLRIFN